MIKINTNKIQEYIPEIEKLNEPLPLILLPLINTRKYLQKVPVKIKDQILYQREQYQYAEDYNQFLEEEVNEW